MQRGWEPVPGVDPSACAPEQDVSLRAGRVEDLPRLTDLRALRRGTRVEARAWAVRSLERMHREPEGFLLLVIERAQEVVGYGVALRFVPSAGAPAHVAPGGYYLAGVTVDPRHRRAGLGRTLVSQRLDWIRARADEAFYFADDANHASIALHAAAGFAPLTRRFWFPGLAEPDTPMTLYRLGWGSAT